ncbi:MAG: hypothetical protein JW982_13820 [Spirochaetes bacterium]|nr:hypothetical protein [Spirochaetota bacterium]
MNKTSLNINSELFAQLYDICLEYKLSVPELIKKILRYVYVNYNYSRDSMGLTRYQKRISGTSWKCVNVKFSEQECKYNFFCRFKFRISLSKALFIGFVLFIDDILKSLSTDKEKTINSYSIFIEIYKNYFSKEIELFKKSLIIPEKT